MKISELITDKYKLRIPPTVYYDLLADVQEAEEEQEPQTFKWCETCKEYDQEKHCCHRWSKVIRDTVEEMKQEQEPIKPMVEIDLYSVIKQKYIEREVLDKIRAELHATSEMHTDGDYYLRDEWIDEILDRYIKDGKVNEI